MISPIIPWRYRITSRQAVPILAGLGGLLCLLLTLGYFHAREQILAIANAQVNQFVSSISRQDDYSRQWLMRTLPSLAALLTKANIVTTATTTEIDKQITSAISDDRGKQLVEVALIHNGIVQRKYYDSSGIVPLERAAKTFEHLLSKEEILQTKKAFWASPHVTRDRSMHMRYTVPLQNEKGETYGIISSSLAIPWFLNRIRSFSFFKQCLPFLLTEEGEWTLPSQADTDIAFLKERMLHHQKGIISLKWQDIRYIAVFLPSNQEKLTIGVLIPRRDIFGFLDAITTALVTVGIIILILATYGLYRTCKTFLIPLVQLMGVADKLAHGKLTPPIETTSIKYIKNSLETEQLQSATNRLRVALHQRIRDLTIMAQTHERLHGELTFARTIQNSLRPNTLPQIPHIPMAAHVYEAREVCGDMYDCFQCTSDSICCVIGNVAEHGIPAALLTNRIMPCLHELILSGLSPSKALEHVNHVFGTDHKKGGLFISVFVGILDTQSGLFSWASAGQIPPFALMENAAWQLPWSENVPLGIRTHEQYEEQTLQLNSGQSLLFLPQRILSVLNPAGQTYGEKQLQTFLTNNHAAPEKLLKEVLKDVKNHAQSSLRDDIVLFAMQWYAPTAQKT